MKYFTNNQPLTTNCIPNTNHTQITHCVVSGH